MNLIPIFQVLCGIFAAAAVYFYWTGDSDLAFFTAVVSICSYFLSLRFKIKSRLDAQRLEEESAKREQ